MTQISSAGFNDQEEPIHWYKLSHPSLCESSYDEWRGVIHTIFSIFMVAVWYRLSLPVSLALLKFLVKMSWIP